MPNSQRLIDNTLMTGAAATAATTAAIAAGSLAENNNAAAGLNAVSHIVWGDEAAEQDDISVRHTVTGLALNAAAMMTWAAAYEYLLGSSPRQSAARKLLGGAAIAGLAYVTDYFVVPRRLAPGFEKRLSPRSMLGIYTALALSLAFGKHAASLVRGKGRR